MKIKGIHSAPALGIAVLLLLAAVSYIDIGSISGNNNPYLTLTLLQIVCMGIPAVFFCILRGVTYSSKLRIKLIRASNFTVMVYALLMLICGTTLLGTAMYSLFPEQFAATSMTASSEKLASSLSGITAAVTFGIIPAILEEFLCRGIICAEYAPYGNGVAVFFSSMIFAMLHFTPVRFPIYFFAGVILALCASVTGSVIASATVHIAYNIFVLFFEKYLYMIVGKHTGGIIILIFLSVAVFLLSSAMFFGKAQKIYERYAEACRPSPKRRKREAGESPFGLQALVSPTFLILIVFYLIVSVILK